MWEREVLFLDPGLVLRVVLYGAFVDEIRGSVVCEGDGEMDSMCSQGPVPDFKSGEGDIASIVLEGRMSNFNGDLEIINLISVFPRAVTEIGKISVRGNDNSGIICLVA